MVFFFLFITYFVSRFIKILWIIMFSKIQLKTEYTILAISIDSQKSRGLRYIINAELRTTSLISEDFFFPQFSTDKNLTSDFLFFY